MTSKFSTLAGASPSQRLERIPHVGGKARLKFRPPVESQRNGPSADFSVSAERLRAKARTEAHPATSWRPEVGDELIGRLIRVDTRPTKQSAAERVAVLECEDGSHVGAWLFYRVLADEWDQADPQPGELVLLERLPDGVAKGHGGAFRRYRVTVDRAEPPGDWLLAEGGAL